MTILDTNVVSERVASSPLPNVLGWIVKRQKSDRLSLTTITIAEILYGVELVSQANDAAALRLKQKPCS